MPDDDLSAEQEAEAERLAAEVVREAARVGVVWETAAERMRALAEQETRRGPDGRVVEVTLSADLDALLDTLRRLPDDAGTERFLEAYVARGGRARGGA